MGVYGCGMLALFSMKLIALRENAVSYWHVRTYAYLSIKWIRYNIAHVNVIDACIRHHMIGSRRSIETFGILLRGDA